MNRNICFFILLGSLSACAFSHTVRPLGKGHQAAHVSIAGTVAGVGQANKFIPRLTGIYQYGITDRLDVYGGWHVLETLINNGNAFFDLGVSYYVFDQHLWIPGLSVALTISPLINKKFWMFLDVPVIASWFVDELQHHLLYIGFHNSFMPIQQGVVASPIYTWSPLLGYRFQPAGIKWLGLTAEMKWYRPYASLEKSVAKAFAPGQQGALSFFIGCSFLFEPTSSNTELTP